MSAVGAGVFAFACWHAEEVKETGYETETDDADSDTDTGKDTANDTDADTGMETAADTETDISKASLGAKVVNTASINPDDADNIYITVDTDEDLLSTEDGGTTWDNVDTTLGFDATALTTLFSGAYFLNRYFVAGDNGADLDVLYSPNNGSSDTNVEDATLGAKANITNIEVTET